MRRRSDKATFLLLPLLVLALMAPRVGAAASDGAQAQQRATAEALLEAGDADGALRVLHNLTKKSSRDAEALLLSSTAHFMNGNIAPGRAELDRALEVDPSLRQAWLNRAALDISEKQLGPALEALLEARELDPAAPDNDINIGAVLLLMGRLEEADRSFANYLSAEPRSAEAHFLVASNYAMAGLADRAVQMLEQATALDELSRLRARTDPNFAALAGDPAFRRLLATDSFRPPAGSLHATGSFDTPYEGPNSLLLATVLEVVQFSNRPMAPRVEVTDHWALVWTDVRIKVATGPDGKGQVTLTAPPRSFTAGAWRGITEEMLAQMNARLLAKSLTQPSKPE